MSSAGPVISHQHEVSHRGGGGATGHRTVRRAPTGHATRHKGTMRCEHCSNHQMRRTPREPSANTPALLPLQGAHVLHKGGGCAPRAGRCLPRGGNRAVNSQPRTGQSTSYGDVKSSYGGAGGWDRRGCATWAPRSATRQGEEQHKHTERGSHTKRDKGGHTRQGGGAQQGRRGNQNSGNREPEWMVERAHGRQRQERGWLGQPAPSLAASGCQGNPCSTCIRWGGCPAAQMGCLRNRSGSPSGADQP